jgi:hypothetical protein
MRTSAPEAAFEGSSRHEGEASRGKRYSKYITRHQAKNLLEALSFADERGLRLNVAIDICWPMFSGVVDERTRFARCQQRRVVTKTCTVRAVIVAAPRDRRLIAPSQRLQFNAICKNWRISQFNLFMDPSEAYDFSRRPRRRDDAKRQRVEAAARELVRFYGLSPQTGQALSERIYELYRNFVAQKTFDDQDREYRKSQYREEQKLAVRTANASSTEVSAYVADAREYAARMTRLEILERRNIGRGMAIEQASKVSWDDLLPQERRKARQYLTGNVLPGNKTRQPAREVEFLRSVAGLVEQATGHRIRFSSNAPGSHRADRPRHCGVEFEVMMAAAEMADYQLTNEALARRIQRIRRQ